MGQGADGLGAPKGVTHCARHNTPTFTCLLCHQLQLRSSVPTLRMEIPRFSLQGPSLEGS